MADPGYLVMDLETTPDREIYNPPVKEGPPPFPPLAAHRIIVMGVAYLDSQLHIQKISFIGKTKSERDLLVDYSGFLNSHKPHLITYNGRSFDAPVITLRCMKHGVSIPAYFKEKDYRYRYSDVGHLDMYDALSEFGATKQVGGLDLLSRSIGLPGKQGVHGSQVEDHFLAGNLEIIQTYCLGDVIETLGVFLRYLLVQGKLSLELYRDRATELLQFIETKPTLHPFLEAVDRPRFLLTE